MDATNKNKIIDALHSYLGEHKMNNADFSKKSGVSEAYLSDLLTGKEFHKAGQGKLVEIADKYYMKIAKAIDFNLIQPEWEVRKTLELISMIGYLQDAKQYAYTNVLIGESGCGKSHAVEIFKNKFPKNCYVITVGYSDNLSDLLDKIVDAMKLVDVPRSKSARIRHIIKKLQEMKYDGKKPMLIFDEAEYMKQPALCSIKELYDGLKDICAIILVGTDQLTRKIEKLTKGNKDGIPQFFRRIHFTIRQLPELDRDFKLFIAEYDADFQKFLRSICHNYGELHDVLVPAKREAERTGEELNEGFIRKIFNI